MNWANWVLVVWFGIATTMNAIEANKPTTNTVACGLNMGLGMLGMFVATQAGMS